MDEKWRKIARDNLSNLRYTLDNKNVILNASTDQILPSDAPTPRLSAKGKPITKRRAAREAIMFAPGDGEPTDEIAGAMFHAIERVAPGESRIEFLAKLVLQHDTVAPDRLHGIAIQNGFNLPDLHPLAVFTWALFRALWTHPPSGVPQTSEAFAQALARSRTARVRAVPKRAEALAQLRARFDPLASSPDFDAQSHAWSPALDHAGQELLVKTFTWAKVIMPLVREYRASNPRSNAGSPVPYKTYRNGRLTAQGMIVDGRRRPDPEFEPERGPA